MNKEKIIALHISLVAKLRSAIEGTEDFKEGQLLNPQAPCLIRGAIYDSIMLLSEINKQEEK